MERVTWGVPSFWIERFPLYYGRWRGFFRERGIDLQIRYLWGGPELAASVSRGEIWIGEMGLPPFLKACAEGLPAVAIGSSTIQQLDHYLVARPEIAKMSDLKGRRLGILSAGSCDDYFARVMLKSSGLAMCNVSTNVIVTSAGCVVGPSAAKEGAIRAEPKAAATRAVAMCFIGVTPNWPAIPAVPPFEPSLS